MSVEALIARWRDQGDERAAEALYGKHRGDVFGLAYGMLGNPEDAEEVAQDTLYYALAHIDRYDPGRAGFRTWLHRICVSRCRDRFRRRKLQQISLGAWLGARGDVTDPRSGLVPRPIRNSDRFQHNK